MIVESTVSEATEGATALGRRCPILLLHNHLRNPFVTLLLLL